MEVKNTISDQELLERAAKAVGMDSRMRYCDAWKGMAIYTLQDGYSGPTWNPLKDDGDALRLLAALPSLWMLSLRFGAPTVEMDVAWGTGSGINISEFAGEGVERRDAIRLAIVRAAAKMTQSV